MPKLILTCLLLMQVIGLQSQALAQSANTAPSQATNDEKPAPYDVQLSRLSEILGALQYIEGLCVPDQPITWREDMLNLIDIEMGNEPNRKQRMTASFNRGYRSFASVYSKCTQPARLAYDSYRNEGATLAKEITTRFGT